MVKKKKIRFTIRDRKIPQSNATHIGLEIECVTELTRSELRRRFSKEGLAQKVQVGDDSSIDGPEDKVAEVRVLTNVRSFRKDIARVATVLRRAGARVNRSCGLHVHIDSRQRDPKILYSLFRMVEPFLFNCVSRSRQYNNYCYRSNQSSMFSHHAAINIADEHRTIEIRMHQGTTDERKITRWVELLLAITKRYKDPPKLPPGRTSITRLDELVRYFPLKQGAIRHWRKRIKKFASPQTSNASGWEVQYGEE